MAIQGICDVCQESMDERLIMEIDRVDGGHVDYMCEHCVNTLIASLRQQVSQLDKVKMERDLTNKYLQAARMRSWGCLCTPEEKCYACRVIAACNREVRELEQGLASEKQDGTR